MSKLDEFFKDKFENRTFEFQDAYWEEAEKLIDQDNRKQKGLWWWRLSGLLLLLLLIIGGAWWLFNTQVTNQPEVTQSIQQIETEQPEKQSPVFSEVNSKESDSTIGPDQNNKNATEQKASLEVNEKQNYEQSANKTGVSIHNQEQTTTLKSTPKESISASTLSSPLAQEKAPVKKDSDAFTEKVAKIKTNQLEINESEATKLNAGEAPVKIDRAIQRTSEERILPLPLPFILNYNKDSLKLPDLKKWAIQEHTEVDQKGRRVDFGLMAGATLYPYAGGDQQRLIGFSGGLDVRYKVNAKYNLESGLKFRQRTGTFDKVNETSVFYYSFGRSESSLHLIPDQLYYLEAPIGISRFFGKHKLETGLMISYLLGVKGALTNVSEEVPQSSIQEEEGWIEEEGFKKWHWDLYMEYGFRIAPNWQLSAGVYYTPGGILNPPDVAGQRVLKESRPIFFDLGVRYKLF